MDINKKILQLEEEIITIQGNMDKHLINMVIRPFCEKYSIAFTSGMGTYWFDNHKGTRVDLYRDISMRAQTTFWQHLTKVIRHIDYVDNITKFLGSGYDYTPAQKGIIKWT